jgi:hypothetical protein
MLTVVASAAQRASEVADRCLSHAGFLMVVESANIDMIRANTTVVNALIGPAACRRQAFDSLLMPPDERQRKFLGASRGTR